MKVPSPAPSAPPGRLTGFFAVAAVLIGLAILFRTQPEKKPPVEPPIEQRVEQARMPMAATSSPEELRHGEELAHAVCVSCHLFPEPALLDRVTWGMQVLPAMAEWLGFHDLADRHLELSDRVLKAHIMPDKPAFSVEEWRAICAYYLANAPAVAIPQGERPPIQVGLKQFSVSRASYRGNSLATMIKIDPGSGRIYIGEQLTNTGPGRLVALDRDGAFLSEMEVPSPPVKLQFTPESLLVTLIGSYTPSDELEGKIVSIGRPELTNAGPYTEIITNLSRPADSVLADLNGDRRQDVVVCGYGNILGQLSWFENLGGGKFKEHVLLERPGAIHAEVADLNGDGLPDIVVMMAQAREGIYIFYNQGKGEFKMETVLEKPPAWGFASFQLVDFNKDGHLDILAVNGDNGDNVAYLPPAKSYHGIRLYLNDGSNHFNEAWFYPLNGAYKAIARDFDGDGDLDIAAISFYPDYRRSPRESFVYLENKGGMQFEAFSFPESISGRWIAMDVADVDGDGDDDIVLVAHNYGPTFVPQKLQEKWVEIGPSVILLKNKLH